eukprot:403346921
MDEVDYAEIQDPNFIQHEHKLMLPQIGKKRNFSQDLGSVPLKAQRFATLKNDQNSSILEKQLPEMRKDRSNNLSISPSSRNLHSNMIPFNKYHNRNQSLNPDIPRNINLTILTPSQSHMRLHHDVSVSTFKTQRAAPQTQIGSLSILSQIQNKNQGNQSSLTVRKLSQSALDIESQKRSQSELKYQTPGEQLKQNLKNTLYRVVIRDKQYWNQIENTDGGMENFSPDKLFFENKIQITNVHEQYLKSLGKSKSLQRDNSNAQIPTYLKPKVDSVLNEKGRINKDFYNYYREDINPNVKKNLDEILKEFYLRANPQGASKSMSPYLLANTFKVDFYDLYRGVQDRKDKIKKEKKLKNLQKKLEEIKKTSKDKKQMKSLRLEMLVLEQELKDDEQNRQKKEELKLKLKFANLSQDEKQKLMQEESETHIVKKEVKLEESDEDEDSQKKYKKGGLSEILERNRIIRQQKNDQSQTDAAIKEGDNTFLTGTDLNEDLGEDLFKSDKIKEKEEKERQRKEKRDLLKKIEDKTIDTEERKKAQAKLNLLKKEKLNENRSLQKDSVDDLSFNFYDKLIDHETKNRRHDEKINQVKEEEEIFKKKQQNGGFLSGDQEVKNYKVMMKNFSTNNKKFLDALRNKVTQELRDFKRSHNLLLKQLATSERKKKVQDDSLAGLNSIFKESNQNQRILDELIQEAKEFDTRLAKMGLNISVKDLLNDKEEKQQPQSQLSQISEKQEVENDEDEDEDSKPKRRRIREIGEDEEDFRSSIKDNVDFAKLGVFKPQDVSKHYMPKQSKLISFSDKTFNPYLVIPQAPNK